MGGIKLFSFTGLIVLILTAVGSLFVWNVYFDDDAQANIKRRVNETVDSVKTYSKKKRNGCSTSEPVETATTTVKIESVEQEEEEEEKEEEMDDNDEMMNAM